MPEPDMPTPGEPQTAPELPHAVAKEYGVVHRAAAKVSPKTAKAEKEQSTPKDQPAATDSATDTTDGADAADAEESVTAGDASTPSATSDSNLPPSIDENPETDAAVDNIVKQEGDELLDMRQELPAATPPPRKHHNIFAWWWRHKWLRWLTILLVVGAIGFVAATPRWRYAALNWLGVRSSASVVVVDNTTQLPLKNVSVSLGSERVLTDVHGIAHFTHMRLGNYGLVISRLAFASSTQQVTIGWGSNPLGTYKLSAVGLQYTFTVTDYLSGQPVVHANAENNDFNALSDDTGKVIFTVDNADMSKLTLDVSADGYRSTTIILDATNRTPPTLALVPSQKAVFMSTSDGKYGVYTSDLDGQNRKLILAGTGNEGSDNSLVVSPDNTQAALVSTRDATKDSAGYALTTLTLINLQNGASTTVDHAEQIALLDWIGDKLVYRTTTTGDTSATASKLIAYTYATNAKLQLATASQFSAIVSVGGALYYSTSGNDSQVSPGLFKIQPDGTSKQQVLDKDVWSVLHTTYDTLDLQTPDGWYAYTIAGGQAAKTTTPTNFNTYLFAPSPSGKRVAWVAAQSGQGSLQLHQSNADKQIAMQVGLTYPLHWLNDTTLLYRVTNGNTSSDYVVSTIGGTPHKVVDVTPSFGFAQAN